MGKLTKSQLWDRSKCKVCNHPNVEQINRDILNADHLPKRKSLTVIAKENPPLNKQNVQRHWEYHVQGLLKHRTAELLEEEATRRVNTVNEVTNMFEEWEALYDQLINTLDPQQSDYVAKLNAARSFLALKNTLCNTNAKLMKEDLDMRNVTDVTELMDKVKTQWKKLKGKKLDVAVIEQTTNDHS